MRTATRLPAQETRFPLALVCPQCARPLSWEAACPCGAGVRLESWRDLPRTLLGQNYWGECDQETMHAFLERMEATPWREALKQSPGGKTVYHHLTSGVGPDFVYGMPWDNIRTVLEIGAGMGFMTAPMAKFAEHIVAVEAVPERALFLKKRAAQDGLDNIYPLIGSGAALPFKPGTFDLVALNGVFEYIGLWGKGNPQQLQERFLARACELLRPGGYLYIGIETRYALGAWLGGRDHSGLRFTSLLPRPLADWYCRAFPVPFYGSNNVVRGYRTYTHSPRQYESMVRGAGFETVEIHGVFDGYNRQIALYPLRDYRARQLTRNMVDVAGSWLGAARRWIGDSRLLYRTLEGEVVVFARKAPPDGPLAWSCLKAPGTVTQINTGGKVFALTFADGNPKTITKSAKNEGAKGGITREFAFLEALEHVHASECGAWPLRWARPLRAKTCHGQSFFEYEFASGFALSKLLIPRYYQPRTFRRLFAHLVQRYLELSRRLSEPRTEAGNAGDLWNLGEALAAVDVSDAAGRARIKQACDRLPRRTWRAGLVHGDLTVNNVIVQADKRMILVDWENASRTGLAALDLLRLLYDMWVDARNMKPATRATLRNDARQIVRDALTPLGIRPDDYADLEALFLAHQWHFTSSRNATDAEMLLKAYDGREFALA